MAHRISPKSPVGTVLVLIALGVALWGPRAHAGTPVQGSRDDSALTLEQGELWEFPDPTLWFAEYRSAEEEFGLLQARWIRARAVNQTTALTRGELEQARLSYEAARTTLIAQQGSLEQGIIDLERGLKAARGDLALGSKDPTVRAEAMLQLDSDVDEAAARSTQAIRSLRSHLLTLGSAALPAREALARYSAQVDDVARADGTDNAQDLARLDNARLDLNVAVQGLDETAAALTDILFSTVSTEIKLRTNRERLRARLRDPADPYNQGTQLDRVRELERALLARQTRLTEVLDTIDQLDRDLASIASDVEAMGETRGEIDQLRERVQQLSATYDRLYLALPSLDAHIDMDAWCAVQVHGALLRSMLGADGAPSLMQNAAAAYGGTCEQLMADQLEVPAFAALWGAALLRLRLMEPSALVFDLGGGSWTLDGTPLVGAGASVYHVAPGVHRLEYHEHGRTIPQEERIDPGERLCVGMSLSGSIVVTPCPIGAAADPTMPTRPPYSAHLAPEGGGEAPRPRTYLAPAALWLRFPGAEGTRDLLGGSLELGWRVGPSPRGLVHVVFHQDLAYSADLLALSNTLDAHVVPRERLGVAAIPDWGVVNPFIELGTGLIIAYRTPMGKGDDGAPAIHRALPPPLLFADLGVQVRLSTDLSFVSAISASQTFWAESGFQPLPAVRLGLQRWM